ncbi:helix-turn-helix domain-containing protein [Tumebacillus algifaecis]|uniref:helix-turn-helix domain-containing protein n=1 Tax=Tumebacillus algifaecis TaxID=1214604 RepID=UPI0012FD0F94|nr:helix-turn-helix transcriptional regulator [Tumebacillus algifaecis]
MTLGQRLKEARKKKRLTQSDVAQTLGIDFTTVSKHENDKYEPDVETLKAYAELYEEELSYLLTGEYGKDDKSGTQALDSNQKGYTVEDILEMADKIPMKEGLPPLSKDAADELRMLVKMWMRSQENQEQK